VLRLPRRTHSRLALALSLDLNPALSVRNRKCANIAARQQRWDMAMKVPKEVKSYPFRRQRRRKPSWENEIRNKHAVDLISEAVILYGVADLKRIKLA